MILQEESGTYIVFPKCTWPSRGATINVLQDTVSLVPLREIMNWEAGFALSGSLPRLLTCWREVHNHRSAPQSPIHDACVEMHFRITHPCWSFLGHIVSRIQQLVYTSYLWMYQLHQPCFHPCLHVGYRTALIELTQKVSTKMLSPSLTDPQPHVLALKSANPLGFPRVYTLVKTREKEGVKGWRA